MVRCVPYAYESTGDETWFTCHMVREPTARRVYWFHRPETLEWQVEDHVNHGGGTLRARIPDMPILAHDPSLRDAQFDAPGHLDRVISPRSTAITTDSFSSGLRIGLRPCLDLLDDTYAFEVSKKV